MSRLYPVALVFFLLAGGYLLQILAHTDNGSIFQQAQHALDKKRYRHAQRLFSELSSPESFFGEGMACYRIQNFSCAQRSFAAAAWAFSDSNKRAIAIFNLANSFFFAGDYDQAIVLYRDAKILGIDTDMIDINMSYAVSMQSARQRHIQHLKQNFNRALWKAAAAGEKVSTLTEFMSNNENYLPDEDGGESVQTLYQASQHAFQSNIIQQLGMTNKQTQQVAGKWIETERILPQSTAKMLNRLFEMELGINVSLSQPKLVEGKRKW